MTVIETAFLPWWRALNEHLRNRGSAPALHGDARYYWDMGHSPIYAAALIMEDRKESVEP